MSSGGKSENAKAPPAPVVVFLLDIASPALPQQIFYVSSRRQLMNMCIQRFTRRHVVLTCGTATKPLTPSMTHR